MPDLPAYDAERESYLSLADEMNDLPARPWVEADWEPQAVAEGKAYAERHGLPWPPQQGDFDRWFGATWGPANAPEAS